MAVFVLDASVTLAWCFADEATPITNQLLGRLRSGEQAAVPAHWPLEILNGILMAKRRSRVSEADAARFLKELASLDIIVEQPPNAVRLEAVAALSDRHRLTSYDTAYLELAIRARLPLASLDQALRQAAHAEGVSLLVAV